MEPSLTRGFDIESGPVLAVDTGLEAEQAARAGVARLLSERGSLVGVDGNVSSWLFEGTEEIDGRVFAYGSAFSGKPLFALMEHDPAAALDAVRRLCSAAASLPPRLVPAGILVAGDGSVLLLPEKVCVRALESRGGAASVDFALRWNHPDLTGSSAAAFSLASLCYRVLCGSAPFAEKDGDRLSADIRDGRALPSRYALPGLDSALVAILDEALGIGTDARVRPGAATPADLLNALGPAGSRAPTEFARKLSAEEAERLDREKARWVARAEKRIGGRRFLRKRGGLLAGAAIAAIALAAIGWSIVDGRSGRFTTAGLSPRRTVETFYEALNELDTEKLQACVVPPAAKGDIDAATNMFVIFRVRAAYEREGGFVPAEKWIAEGSPATGRAVYGIVGLSIDEAAGENRFIARYRFFVPGSQAEERTDTLALERLKGTWRIARLDREARGAGNP